MTLIIFEFSTGSESQDLFNHVVAVQHNKSRAYPSELILRINIQFRATVSAQQTHLFGEVSYCSLQVRAAVFQVTL